MAIRCIQCGDAGLQLRGELPAAKFFCGVPLGSDWVPGRLFDCTNCKLVFRYPVMAAEAYASLYAKSSAEAYSNTDLRSDQKLVVSKFVQLLPNGKILDVGCFDGLLLSSLPGRYLRFGVEASRAAVEVAQRRNVEIVAATAEEIIDSKLEFDGICAVDVLEHLTRPDQFIGGISRCLRSGGYFIFTTGDSSNKLWRFFGGRYWYCAFPEHITFASPQWVRLLLHSTNFELVEIKTFKHRGSGFSRVAAYSAFSLRLLSGLMYKLSFGLLGKLHQKFRRHKVGYPGVVSDHILVVLRKRS